MSRLRNILLVGVGGQGTILAGKVLSRAAVRAGLDVKFSEIHGMAQRGGSVVTQVRIGERVFSPVIDPGEADFVVAFEQLEAVRWAHALRRGGVLIASTQVIEPITVLSGTHHYPASPLAQLNGRTVVRSVDAPALAEKAGSRKASNLVLLGVLASELGLAREVWEQALLDTVPAASRAANQRAFALGWERVSVPEGR